MGILSATGAANTEATPSPEPSESEPEAPDAEELPAASPDGVDEPPPADGSDPPQQRASRRNRTAEAIERHTRTLREEMQREREADRQRLQGLEQQNARLYGQMEAYQRAPAAPPPPPVPQEDPTDLRRRAREALDSQKFDEYERLNARAHSVDAERIADARVKAAIDEMRRQMPTPIDPFVSSLLSQHRNVAMAGTRGESAVEIKLGELKLMGAPNGRQTLAKAFELADKWLGTLDAPARQPAFSQDGSVSGIPTGRAGNGSATSEGPALNDVQKRVAESMRMSPAEYMKWQDPAKNGIRKW